jgi:16S rRNA (uracil1498-N3)-methyltransferase
MNDKFVLHYFFMALPFFYKEDLVASCTDLVLDEATSKHVVQVLRMQNGEQLQLTNGKGILFTAEITDNNRKKCAVKILQTFDIPHSPFHITIAISPVKNNTRFEWFLEKATEIGVSEIIPLVCSRTEKTTFKFERMKSILVSAMLQSQQCWLPVLHESTKFSELVRSSVQQQKFIAHCMDDVKRGLSELNNEALSSKIILIGPEGDFTRDEAALAQQHHFCAVNLGENRLRTETAGIVAACLLCLV